MIYSLKDFEMRTKETYERDANIGTKKIPKSGIKGKTIISELVDLPDAIPIDYMHLLCLGLFKNILIQCIESSNHSFDFYIGKFYINIFYRFI